MPGPSSDDFSGADLGGMWSFEGPGGEVSLGRAGDEAYLELVVPSGNFDPWQVNRSVRLLQDAADEDFGVEARFLSTPTARHQIQGILVEQDADNWLRFDTYSDGNKQFVFAGATVNGSSSQKIKVVIAAGAAEYLRVERSGDSWELKYSANGSTWTTAGSFNQALDVTGVGPFAGATTSAPGYTAQVDYFFDSAAPIANEDGTIENVAPVAQDDVATTDQDTPVVLSVAALLANDSDADGDPLELMDFTQPGDGSVEDNGDGTLTYTPDPGFSGDDSFTYTVTDGTDTDTATVTIAVEDTSEPPTTPAFASDDFSGASLAGMWSLEGPGGSAALGRAGGEAYLELVVPTGNFDPWQVNRSVRLLQDAADEDFGVEARFLSTPTERHQTQGILVEQNANNWMRFDTYSDGNKQYVFAGATVNGSSSQKIKVTIAAGAAEYLRVERSGDSWELKYSADGQAWTTAGSFTQAMNVTGVGPFAGVTTSAPGYTAQVDYFFDSAAPIADEDGTIENLAPVAQDDVATTEQDTPVILSVAALLANDIDPDGDPLELMDFTQPGDGSVEDNGDGTLTYTPDPGFNGDDTFTYRVTDGTGTDTATVTVAVDGVSVPPGSTINVWYGLEQEFGNPGEAQQWVNILGNVAESVSDLSYSLNGGPERTLSIGPDNRRLDMPGDFNVDLDYAELNGSAVDDVVTLRAVLDSGQAVTQDVVIDYQDGRTWPQNQTIDWASVNNLQDVVQVVDGLWTHSNSGVHPIIPGYDRILALGDRSWDNYEATLAITPYDLSSQGNGVGILFGMLFNGHTDKPIAGMQPKTGWEPHAAFYYRNADDGFSIRKYAGFNSIIDQEGFNINEGETYNVRLRVEQSDVFDRTYSLKIWEDGNPEPGSWLVQGTEDFNSPVTGAFYLNAHHWGVEFHDVEVREITGHDILVGDNGNDVLAAFDFGQGDTGEAEIDVLVGNGGSDVFVLGDAGGAYYDDGDDATAGTDSYALIWDFVSGQDQIRLSGSMDQYALGSSTSGLPSGTAVYAANENGPDELIGIVHDVSGLSLASNDFLYDAPMQVVGVDDDDALA